MTRIDALIDLALKYLSGLLAVIGGVALVLMMVQTVADVIADQFFSRPIPGNLEVISVHHMVLVVFLPLAFVERRHEHIQVDLVYQLMPRLMQRCTLVFGYLISTGFFVVLAWRTWGDAMRSLAKNEMMMGNVYVIIWPAKFVLPIGFAAIGLVVLLHAWRAATDSAFSPEPAATEEGHI
ncbi:TRAP transporter small permease subunit [Roseovarius sp. B08]|uniref:TRAP transporter small permease subunit n=1 Tax=Roseovarius sp. B08 TaxID=3449223 RepID=UPI003EDB924C